LDLVELLNLSDEEFLHRFQGTSIMRAKRIGLQKNACVAMGNNRDESAVPTLGSILSTDSSNADPLVRSHAAWALGQIANKEALGYLEQSLVSETDEYVREEINAALRESAQ